MDEKNDKGATLFVDGDVRVYRGDEARERLARKSDARFLRGDLGVLQVDHDRWQEAQHYERRTWMELARFVADDHNREHLDAFRGYEALRGRTFERAIELGCGPFTNLRLILEVARAKEIYLLDPLAREYVGHPLCRYRQGRLGGLRTLLSLDAVKAWLRPVSFVREVVNAIRIGGLRGRTVHIEPLAIEDFQPDRPFDLVVMINVLEHCRDAEAILRRIDEMLRPGGVFVFRDRVWDAAELDRTIGTLYDAGHPLRVGRRAIEPFLGRFESLLREERVVVEVECGLRLTRTALSFIGRKRP